MHLLGCLDEPSAGHYWFNGQDVNALKPRERSFLRGTQLGFVFQSFYLISNLTTVENVALPLLYRPGAKKSAAQQQALAALNEVGLAGRAHHRPVELSGGERQRVAIARALVNRPLFLLADEPTGNLDSARGVEVMNMLVDLWRAGLTILLVTHDAAVADYARRVIWMKDGQIFREERKGESV
jgi:putative ABC transport system ATP-binding protein